jgi:hypothetical protein
MSTGNQLEMFKDLTSEEANLRFLANQNTFNKNIEGKDFVNNPATQPTFLTGLSVVNSTKNRMLLGNAIATERLKTTEIKHEKKAGIAFVENKHLLDCLEVKFDSECVSGLKRGHHVYIRQNHYNAPWSANFYILDGEEFILIPRDQIVLVEFS